MKIPMMAVVASHADLLATSWMKRSVRVGFAHLVHQVTHLTAATVGFFLQIQTW
jgi:hypothetical protein